MNLIKKKLFVLCILMTLGVISFAQERHITGKVSSSENYVIAGAGVIVKGSQGGTSTDAEGNFRISANPGTTILVVSYPGCTTQEVSVPASVSNKNITLNCSFLELKSGNKELKVKVTIQKNAPQSKFPTTKSFK